MGTGDGLDILDKKEIVLSPAGNQPWFCCHASCSLVTTRTVSHCNFMVLAVIEFVILSQMRCYCTGETSGVSDLSTRLSDRSRAYYTDGEAWDWYRCFHSCPHQQYQPTELCYTSFWSSACSHTTWHHSGAWLSKG